VVWLFESRSDFLPIKILSKPAKIEFSDIVCLLISMKSCLQIIPSVRMYVFHSLFPKKSVSCHKNLKRKPNTAELKMLQARFDWAFSWSLTGLSRIQHLTWTGTILNSRSTKARYVIIGIWTCSAPCPVFVWGPSWLLAAGSCCWVVWVVQWTPSFLVNLVYHILKRSCKSF
jgi:hypothetical protein